MEKTPVTKALREIREEAKVGLREMARRLGVPPNTYSHYENAERFKAPYLPMQMAINFAKALAPEGIAPERVLALAGHGDGATAENFDERLANLSPDRREKVLQYLADQEALHAQAELEPGRELFWEDP